MSSPESESRRRLLRNIALAASAGALVSTQLRAAEELPLLAVDDPAAKAVKYAEDAKKVKEAENNSCANCSLYNGKDGSVQGPCQIIKGKAVKAAGWCNGWAPQI
ncbi:MAG: high-potential iron-sulfur protein [Gammaproteobacteria bacterium]